MAARPPRERESDVRRDANEAGAVPDLPQARRRPGAPRGPPGRSRRRSFDALLAAGRQRDRRRARRVRGRRSSGRGWRVVRRRFGRGATWDGAWLRRRPPRRPKVNRQRSSRPAERAARSSSTPPTTRGTRKRLPGRSRPQGRRDDRGLDGGATPPALAGLLREGLEATLPDEGRRVARRGGGGAAPLARGGDGLRGAPASPPRRDQPDLRGEARSR